MRNENNLITTNITAEDRLNMYIYFASQVVALNDSLHKELKMAGHTIEQLRIESNNEKNSNTVLAEELNKAFNLNTQLIENMSSLKNEHCHIFYQMKNEIEIQQKQMTALQNKCDEYKKIMGNLPGNETQTTTNSHKRGQEIESTDTGAKRYKPEQDQPAPRQTVKNPSAQIIDLDPDQDANMNNASRDNSPSLDLLERKSPSTAIDSIAPVTFVWKSIPGDTFTGDTFFDQIIEQNEWLNDPCTSNTERLYNAQRK